MRRLFTSLFLLATLRCWAANPSYEDFWTNHFLRVGNQLRIKTNVTFIATNITDFTDIVFTNDGTNIRVLGKPLNQNFLLFPSNQNAGSMRGIVISNAVPGVRLIPTNNGLNNRWELRLANSGRLEVVRPLDNFGFRQGTNGEFQVIGPDVGAFPPSSPYAFGVATNDGGLIVDKFGVGLDGDASLIRGRTYHWPLTNAVVGTLYGLATIDSTNLIWTSLVFQPANTNLSNWANLPTNVIGGAAITPPWTNDGTAAYLISNTNTIHIDISGGGLTVGTNTINWWGFPSGEFLVGFRDVAFGESGYGGAILGSVNSTNNSYARIDFSPQIDVPTQNILSMTLFTNGVLHKQWLFEQSTNDLKFSGLLWDDGSLAAIERVVLKPTANNAADSVAYLFDTDKGIPSATNAFAFRTKGTNRFAVAGDAVFPNDPLKFFNGSGRWSSVPGGGSGSLAIQTNSANLGQETNFNLISGLGIQFLGTNVAGTNQLQILVVGQLTNWVNIDTNILLTLAGVDGLGTVNFLPIWTATNKLGNSLMRQVTNAPFNPPVVTPARTLIDAGAIFRSDGLLAPTIVTTIGGDQTQIDFTGAIYYRYVMTNNAATNRTFKLGDWVYSYQSNDVAEILLEGNGGTSLTFSNTANTLLLTNWVTAAVGDRIKLNWNKLNGKWEEQWRFPPLTTNAVAGGSGIATNANQFLGDPLSIKNGASVTNLTNFGIMTFATDPLGNVYQITTANDLASLFMKGQQSSFNVHSNGMFSVASATVGTNVGFLIYFGGDGQHIFEVMTNGNTRLTSDGNRQYDLSPSDTLLSIFHVGQQASFNVHTSGLFSLASATIGTNAGFEMYNAGDGVVFFGIKTNVPGSGDFLALDGNAFLMRTNGVTQGQLNNASNVLRTDISTLNGMTNLWVLELNGVATNLTTYSGSPSLTVVPVTGTATNSFQVLNTNLGLVVFVTSNDVFTASNVTFKGSNVLMTALLGTGSFVGITSSGDLFKTNAPSGGSGTNSLAQTNGTTVGSFGTLNFVAGQNTTVTGMVNGSVVTLAVNSSAGGGNVVGPPDSLNGNAAVFLGTTGDHITNIATTLISGGVGFASYGGFGPLDEVRIAPGNNVKWHFTTNGVFRPAAYPGYDIGAVDNSVNALYLDREYWQKGYLLSSAANTNLIDLLTNEWKTFTNALVTNHVFILSNNFSSETIGAFTRVLIYGAETPSNYTVTVQPPAGTLVSWLTPTNGTFDFAVSSNKVGLLSLLADRSTNIWASYIENTGNYQTNGKSIGAARVANFVYGLTGMVVGATANLGVDPNTIGGTNWTQSSNLLFATHFTNESVRTVIGTNQVFSGFQDSHEKGGISFLLGIGDNAARTYVGIQFTPTNSYIIRKVYPYLLKNFGGIPNYALQASIWSQILGDTQPSFQMLGESDPFYATNVSQLVVTNYALTNLNAYVQQGKPYWLVLRAVGSTNSSTHFVSWVAEANSGGTAITATDPSSWSANANKLAYYIFTDVGAYLTLDNTWFPTNPVMNMTISNRLQATVTANGSSRSFTDGSISVATSDAESGSGVKLSGEPFSPEITLSSKNTNYVRISPGASSGTTPFQFWTTRSHFVGEGPIFSVGNVTSEIFVVNPDGIITSSGGMATNTANITFTTNDWALNTYYTNVAQRALVTGCFWLAPSSTNDATVALYIDYDANGTWDQTGIEATSGRGVVSSNSVQLVGKIQPSARFVWTNLTVGTATATIKPGSAQWAKE